MSTTTPTYHGADFRTYPPERVAGPDGTPIAMQLCEDRDPESGRWEPFYAMRHLTTR
jgi:hypothetical protein